MSWLRGSGNLEPVTLTSIHFLARRDRSDASQPIVKTASGIPQTHKSMMIVSFVSINPARPIIDSCALYLVPSVNRFPKVRYMCAVFCRLLLNGTTQHANEPAQRATMTAADPRPKEIIAIQYLRGMAAVAVVVFHLSGRISVSPETTYGTSAMYAGVDLFFVISGFVMAWTTIHSRRVSPWTFLTRRLVRIVPLYWLMTCFMLAVLLVSPEVLRTAKLDWLHVAGSFLFIPVINPATGAYEPLVIPGWTLNYEMAFYLVFAGAIMAGKGEAWRTLLLASGVIAILTAVGQVLPPPSVSKFYTHPIILEFAFGMAAAWIAKNARPARPVILIAVAGVAGIMLLWPSVSPGERAIERGLFAAALVLAAAWISAPKLISLEIVGDASYSIYLSHGVTVAVVMKLSQAFGWLESPALRALTLFGSLAACIAVGIVVWYAIERPLTSAVRKRFGGSTSRPTVSERD
jgi:exopolysaccharide production protein ExoZ